MIANMELFNNTFANQHEWFWVWSSSGKACYGMASVGFNDACGPDDGKGV